MPRRFTIECFVKSVLELLPFRGFLPISQTTHCPFLTGSDVAAALPLGHMLCNRISIRKRVDTRPRCMRIHPNAGIWKGEWLVENHEIAGKLNSLIQLDADAVNAYNQAIEEIKEEDVRSTVESYREDHQRHIAVLRGLVEDLGEQPQEPSKDIKGFLIEGFTKIRSMGGTDAALSAMETNEKLTNKKYSEASGWDVPAEILDILIANFEDEKEHLAFIQKKLGHEVTVEEYHEV